MPQFEVHAPFAGWARIKAEADSEAQAIERALASEIDLHECVDEFRVVASLGRGVATAERIDETDEI